MPYRLAESPARRAAALLVPCAMVLMAAASLLMLIGQYTDLDLMLADLYFDPAQQRFPWNTLWFANTFMHEWVKNIIVASGVVIVGITAADAVLRFRRISPLLRTRLQVLSIAALSEPLIISSLKHLSSLHCPWGIDRYGGTAPYLRLLDSIPAGWQAGHCFPAGHASAGMWLGALAVFWLPSSPRKALLAYVCGTGIGIFMGWVQQMRGQHFLSHTLWTAWIASALLLMLLAAFAPRLFASADAIAGGNAR